MTALIAAEPASAQEPSDLQIAEASDRVDSPPNGAFHVDNRQLYAGVLDLRTDPRKPRGDEPSTPRIDWGVLAADHHASTIPMTGLAGFSWQPSAATPPEPTHTGFKALVFETGGDFGAFPRRQSTWVILAIGGVAAAMAYPADDEVNPASRGRMASGAS